MTSQYSLTDAAIQQAEFLGLGLEAVQDMARRSAPYSAEHGVNRRFHSYAFSIEHGEIRAVRPVASTCTGMYHVECPACDELGYDPQCGSCNGAKTLVLHEDEFNSYGVLDRHIIGPAEL